MNEKVRVLGDHDEVRLFCVTSDVGIGSLAHSESMYVLALRKKVGEKLNQVGREILVE